MVNFSTAILTHLKESRIRSELQSRQESRSLDVRGDADLSPAFCIGCTSPLGLASGLNRVPAQDQRCRHTIPGTHTDAHLHPLVALPIPPPPITPHHPHHRSH